VCLWFTNKNCFKIGLKESFVCESFCLQYLCCVFWFINKILFRGDICSAIICYTQFVFLNQIVSVSESNTQHRPYWPYDSQKKYSFEPIFVSVSEPDYIVCESFVLCLIKKNWFKRVFCLWIIQLVLFMLNFFDSLTLTMKESFV